MDVVAQLGRWENTWARKYTVLQTKIFCRACLGIGPQRRLGHGLMRDTGDGSSNAPGYMV